MDTESILLGKVCNYLWKYTPFNDIIYKNAHKGLLILELRE